MAPRQLLYKLLKKKLQIDLLRAITTELEVLFPFRFEIILADLQTEINYLQKHSSSQADPSSIQEVLLNRMQTCLALTHVLRENGFRIDELEWVMKNILNHYSSHSNQIINRKFILKVLKSGGSHNRLFQIQGLGNQKMEPLALGIWMNKVHDSSLNSFLYPSHSCPCCDFILKYETSIFATFLLEFDTRLGYQDGLNIQHRSTADETTHFCSIRFLGESEEGSLIARGFVKKKNQGELR